MKFTDKVKSEIDPKYRDMLEGKTQISLSIPEISSIKQVDTEIQVEEKIQDVIQDIVEGDKQREEKNKASARNREKIEEMIKNVAFLLPIILSIGIAIGIFTRSNALGENGSAYVYSIVGWVAYTIVAIIVSSYLIYQNKNDLYCGVLKYRIAAAVVIVAVLVGSVVTGTSLSKVPTNSSYHTIYDVNNIDINFTDKTQEYKSDDYRYYIYFSYKITNVDTASIDYFKFDTEIYVSGSYVTTMSSELGGTYGNKELKLKKGESTTGRFYLSQLQNYVTSDFEKIYEASSSSVTYRHTITSVHFSNGHIYNS